MLFLILAPVAGCVGPEGPAGQDGEDGAPGVAGEEGADGSVSGLEFLGERDGGALTLADSSVVTFTDVTGADTADGSTVFGQGTMMAAGFSLNAGSTGVYEATVNATWSLSLSEETVVARFRLHCTGDVTVMSEPEVLASLGNANSSAVQTHTPFTVSSYVEAEEGGAADCLLQHELEVAGDGSGIVFHGIDGYATASWTLVAQ
jgi:hypothetical protein